MGLDGTGEGAADKEAGMELDFDRGSEDVVEARRQQTSRHDVSASSQSCARAWQQRDIIAQVLNVCTSRRAESDSRDRPENAPEAFEKIESAPENGLVLGGADQKSWRGISGGMAARTGVAKGQILAPNALISPARVQNCNAAPAPAQLSIFSAAMKASCGISTLPNWRILFLPAFCFSRSLRLRVASPP
jgi:hypothetical protein